MMFLKMVRYIMSAFMKQHFMCKILISFTIIVVVLTISLWSDNSERLARKCFSSHVNNEVNNIQLLPDIMTATKKPNLGKSVFFHETSCANGIVSLNARQACAIESAAVSNPTWDIFLLFASPVGFSNDTVKSPILNALQFYSNVHLRNVNLWTYAHDTPISSFINNGQLFRSKYVNSHTSDFLRYLSLYKWGGTYLDLDVIVKKSFDEIEPNYAGAESENFVAAGLINFDYQNVGHEIAEHCLNEFQNTFDGDDWGNNGPGVITRVLQNICQTTHPALMTRDRCKGFKVFPVDRVYAVGWKDWRYFFEEKYTERTMKMTSDSIAIHVWNKHSSVKSIPVGSKVAYGLLAAKYCPKVYESSVQNQYLVYTFVTSLWEMIMGWILLTGSLQVSVKRTSYINFWLIYGTIQLVLSSYFLIVVYIHLKEIKKCKSTELKEIDQ